MMEPRMHTDEHRLARKVIPVLSVLIGVHVWFGSGCSADNHKQPTTKPATAYDRQEEALKDPFGYSPNMDQKEVSGGGGWGHYDRNGMRKDVDHVVNP